MKNDKTQYDDDFEKMLQDFINDELDYDDEDDLETMDTHDEHEEPDEAEASGLPFPRPIDYRVADVLMKSDHEKQKWIDDVTSIDVEVMPGCEKGVYCEGPVAVTLKARSGAELKNHRFTCYVYTDTYYPMCASDVDCEEKHSKRKAYYEIPSLNIWLPGKYILYVVGPGERLVRVDFALDDLLNAKVGKPTPCHSYGIEHTLTSCMQTIEPEWDMVARQPGMAQFRQKMMQERLLLLYNEFRKELEQEAFQPEGNLIINTFNQDVTTGILKLFQRNILSDYDLNCIDCATLFDTSRVNPYELLPEEIDNSDMKILCLTGDRPADGTLPLATTLLPQQECDRAGGLFRLRPRADFLPRTPRQQPRPLHRCERPSCPYHSSGLGAGRTRQLVAGRHPSFHR